MAAARSRSIPFPSDCYSEAGKNATPGGSGGAQRFFKTDYPAGMKRMREQAGRNWTKNATEPYQGKEGS